LHLAPEGLVLRAILAGGARRREEPLVPAAAMEQAFLRRVAEVPLVVHRAAGAIERLDDAQLTQQRAHAARLGPRQRQVVRTPRVRGDGRGAAPRVAPGGVLQLEQRQIGHAAPRQVPGGGETRDATADDHHPHPLGRRRRRQPPGLAQQVAQMVAGADEPALDGRRGAHRAPAGGEEGAAGQQLAAGEPAHIRCHSTP
jgi:hypothetical protein